ncbi:MAG: prolyl-tRNA synthetase associated domain-containing protein [Clostridioides sp.]|jgi:Ala-tRNA(Pro) deacylase|nr:prolyl-tRNA synthetase associated domain-containing protein [Clostridioides sp.]
MSNENLTELTEEQKQLQIENENKVYETLDALDIKYKVVEHEPLYTAEQLNILKDPSSDIYCEGNHCKNLFLRNAKGNKYYLIVAKDDKDVNLKELQDIIGATRLSFASSERLYKVLKLFPGSVNPFSLKNDTESVVDLFIDKDVMNGENLNFHPNVNTKMVNISFNDFNKFLKSLDNEVEIINF